MGVMRVDHPDILAFIDLKSDLSQVGQLQPFSCRDGRTSSRLVKVAARTVPTSVLNPHTGHERHAVAGQCGDGAKYDREAPSPDVEADCYTVRQIWDRIVQRAWESRVTPA